MHHRGKHMKTMQIAVVTILLAVIQGIAGGASDYQTCLEYLTTNTTYKLGIDYFIQTSKDGRTIYWAIDTQPKPTFAQLDAILPTALAWKSNQVAEAAADIDKMEIKYVLRALVKTINKRIPADKQITEDELRVAIKAEAERAIKADVTP